MRRQFLSLTAHDMIDIKENYPGYLAAFFAVFSCVFLCKVQYFRVYNRWGQQVFSTNSLIEGWDGTIKGVKQTTGTYPWMLKVEDLAGKIYEMKGVSTLIR